jgi:hypothetical protein
MQPQGRVLLLVMDGIFFKPEITRMITIQDTFPCLMGGGIPSSLSHRLPHEARERAEIEELEGCGRVILESVARPESSTVFCERIHQFPHFHGPGSHFSSKAAKYRLETVRAYPPGVFKFIDTAQIPGPRTIENSLKAFQCFRCDESI